MAGLLSPAFAAVPRCLILAPHLFCPSPSAPLAGSSRRLAGKLSSLSFVSTKESESMTSLTALAHASQGKEQADLPGARLRPSLHAQGQLRWVRTVSPLSVHLQEKIAQAQLCVRCGSRPECPEPTLKASCILSPPHTQQFSSEQSPCSDSHPCTPRALSVLPWSGVSVLRATLLSNLGSKGYETSHHANRCYESLFLFHISMKF